MSCGALGQGCIAERGALFVAVAVGCCAGAVVGAVVTQLSRRAGVSWPVGRNGSWCFGVSWPMRRKGSWCFGGLLGWCGGGDRCDATVATRRGVLTTASQRFAGLRCVVANASHGFVELRRVAALDPRVGAVVTQLSRRAGADSAGASQWFVVRRCVLANASQWFAGLRRVVTTASQRGSCGTSHIGAPRQAARPRLKIQTPARRKQETCDTQRCRATVSPQSGCVMYPTASRGVH